MSRGGNAGEVQIELTPEASPNGSRASRTGENDSSARPHAVLLEVSVCLTLLVCALYYVYRYPFRINSVVTSPTYRDTPQWLQLGKYGLIAAISTVALAFTAGELRARWHQISATEWVFIAFCFFAMSRGASALVYSHSTYGLQRVAPVVFLMPLTILVALLVGRNGLDRLARIGTAALVIMLVAHAAANALELVLWRTTGRLPALAYAGSLTRFGGLWDDPNSSGVFSAVFLLLVRNKTVRFDRRLRLFLVACATFNIVIAWSYSAYLVLAVGLIVIWLRDSGGLARKVTIVAAVALACLLALEFLPPLRRWPGIGTQLAAKSASLHERVHLHTYFAEPQTFAGWFLGSNATPSASIENAAGVLFSATGLLGLSLFVAWVVLIVRAAAKRRRDSWVVPVVVALVAGSMFVPYLVIFPIGSLLILAVGLNNARIEERSSRAEAVTSTRNGRLAVVVGIFGLAFLAAAPILGSSTALSVASNSGLGVSYGVLDAYNGGGGSVPLITRTRNSAYAQQGRRAFYVRLDNSEDVPRGKYVWTSLKSAIAVKPNQIYRLHADVSGPASPNEPIRLGVRVSSGDVVQESLIPATGGLINKTDATRRSLEGIYTVPTGVRTIQLAVWTVLRPHQTSWFALDDVRIERTRRPG